MSETRFTPGPWVVGEWDRMAAPIYGTGEYCIGEVHDCNDYPENAANAHLIAAAPELYEALEKAANRLAEIGATVPSEVTHALAKARGEA